MDQCFVGMFPCFINVGLIDLTVVIADVIDEVTDKNIVESLVGIVECSVLHGLDGIGDELMAMHRTCCRVCHLV